MCSIKVRRKVCRQNTVGDKELFKDKRILTQEMAVKRTSGAISTNKSGLGVGTKTENGNCRFDKACTQV